MIQHMMLAFAMPPLLLHGLPGWMVRPLLRRPDLLALGRRLTRPAGAFATFNHVLVWWELPPPARLPPVQSGAGGVAPAAPLQPGDGAASGAHRRAPHDHGRLGDPLVAA